MIPGQISSGFRWSWFWMASSVQCWSRGVPSWAFRRFWYWLAIGPVGDYSFTRHASRRSDTATHFLLADAWSDYLPSACYSFSTY